MCGDANEDPIYTDEDVVRISEGMYNAARYSVTIGRPLTKDEESMFFAGFIPASVKVDLESEKTL